MKGHVRRRGPVWEYLIDVGLDPATGKRKRASKSGFRTEKAALAAMRAAIGQVEDGTYRSDNVPTLAAFVTEEWLPARRRELRASTSESYRIVLEERVLPRIGALPLDRITPKHIDELYTELLERGGRDARRGPGLSARTVRYSGTILTRVLRDAVKHGLILRNPAEHVIRPKPRGREMSWWSIADARRFLAHVESDRLAALWALYLTTGMRRGEALGLRWVDVDLEDGRLSVRRTLIAVDGKPEWSEPKTEASRRVISLDSGTVAALRKHGTRQKKEKLALGEGYRDEGLVFATVAGERLHPDNVSKAFDRLVRRAGVPRIRLHDLRHTAATTMLEEGVPLKIVTERLGHSSTRITADLYQHASESMQDDAAAKLGAAFLGVSR